MLSTENPPPDLCEISQLKSGDGGSDERASDTNQQQKQLGVDLFNSGLDYNNQLPNFSIRDYVFNTRVKNIKNSWPFSQKNLQLCLKHGVKDVLPPFHSLGSARNPSIEEECAVDVLRYSDVKYPELNDNGARKRPPVNIENIISSECEEDKEFPSTTTSQSCSDINSVPPIRNSCPGREAQYLPPVSRAVREPKKAESNIQSPAKKSRLVVKLNNLAEVKSNEESAVVSETMTSKVCPVCKTFSSSSNTTLNAHIDQCLSGKSTVKWTSNSKLIKHRIKPRKTRLMVDIYETALCCTLEDLDKRNGTNWASNMSLHPQDPEASTEEAEEDEEDEEKKTYSPVDFEDIDQEGAVYIDSSGTKLRILSKPNHPPPSKPNVNDSGACKLVKRDKGIKLISSKKKKKKHTVQRLEVQKNSLDGQGSCSPVPDQLPNSPPHGPKTCYPRVEVSDGQQKVYPLEGHSKDDRTESPTASDHMKSDDFGMIKQCVGSKRTCLKKKTNVDLENQHLDKSLKNLRIKSVSSLGDRGNSSPISPISSGNNASLPPNALKRKENLCRPLGGWTEWTELPFIRKGPGFSSLRSEHITEKKSHLVCSKFNVKQSRKDSTLVRENLVDHPNHAENHAPCSNKRIGTSSIPTVRNDSSFIRPSISDHRSFSSEGKIATPPRKTSLGHTMPSGGKKFSSLRTKLLSVRHASDAEPKKNFGRDLLSFKNPRLRCTSRSDDEAVVSKSILDAEDNLATALGETATLMEKNCGELLKNRTRVFKLRKRLGGSVNIGEGDMACKGSETSPEPDSVDVGNKMDSFIGGSVTTDTSDLLLDDFVCEPSSLGEEEEEDDDDDDDDDDDVEILDDFVCEPSSLDGEAFVPFRKPLDSAFPGLAGSNVECVSQYYNKAYDETELVFHADQEMFCADNVGKNLVTPDSHEMADMDGDEAQGNYFVDVDPIPIPGPPGSFLPSPGRMGSEELLGHSSLTTCRIQSSDDGHEVVDMDSSDSPISAISTVSNSIAGRSSSISTTNLSAQSHFQHETQHDITEERKNSVAKGSSPPFEQIASGENERNLLKSKADLVLPEVSREVQNIQPCCCFRKDVSLQGASVDYQESQISRRRDMTPPSVLAQEKQMNDEAKNEIRCIDLREETFSQKEPTSVTGKDLVNSPIAYAPVPVPYNSEAMFRACGDCDIPSPSTSNPVLRLMGKNLMVVNKDANLPSQSSMMIDHPGVRLCVENGLSTRNNQNEPNSFNHLLSQCRSMFDNTQAHEPAPRQFDFSSSDPFKIPSDHRPSQSPCHPSTAMYPPSMSFGDNATSASGCHEYSRGTFNLIRPDAARSTYDIQKADSCGGKRKEIIIIDDSPESEDAKATHCSTNMEPMSSSQHVNPFYSYQMRVNHNHRHPFNGSPVVSNRNTVVPPSKGKWNCVAEGSSVRHSNSSGASLPSAAQLRSLYYSPGFS